MVILDSDHSKKHVLSELEIHNNFVTENSYLIAGDTNINGHPVGNKESFPKGIWNRVKSLIPSPLKKYIKRHRNRRKVLYSYKKGGIKLHLGCGSKYLEGYLNVDKESGCADLRDDILDLKFKEKSISEVLMIHVIEHIDYHKLPLFLKKIYNWLEVGGQLIIEFPDVIKVARCILKRQNNPSELQNSPFGIMGLYGKSFLKMSIHHYHKWGWTEITMKALLKKVGFKKICTEKPQCHGSRKKRDTRMVALKQE